MKTIEIKKLGCDFWCREVFTTKKGALVCSVDGKFYTKNNNDFEGEPLVPLKSECLIIVDEFTD